MNDMLVLTLLWLVPLVGSIVVLLLPKKQILAIKATSLGVTIAMMLVSLYAFFLYTGSDTESARSPLTVKAARNTIPKAMTAGGPSVSAAASGATTPSDSNPETAALDTAPGDLVFRANWIPSFNIQYYVGLDGISLSLVLLTGLVGVLSCLASWNIDKHVKGYFSLFLLLNASMMGVFLALDMFLFYVFFEVMLLPMYFLIAVWGGDNREYAAIKFLLYTLFGSVFILVAILILYFWAGPVSGARTLLDGRPFAAHTFDAALLARAASETAYYGRDIQSWIFALFLVGFLVKLPSFPFHTWLPDAHVQAPTPISMILAGILLKIGGYGMIRLAWSLAPAGAEQWALFVSVLAVVSIIYGALAAMAQTDFKKLVAYSSVSHMGYVTLGLAAMNLANDPRYYAYGVNGAMYMMLAHGITSTGMFFLVGVIYERAHTRDLRQLGGLLNIMPVYGAVSFLIFFGSMGLPGLCGFVAEVFVVLAAYNYNYILSIFAAAAVVLTAGYILWTLQRVFLGRNDHFRGLPDLNMREIIISVPLVVFTILLGVFPNMVLSWMGPSVDNVVANLDKAHRIGVMAQARPAKIAEPIRITQSDALPPK